MNIDTCLARLKKYLQGGDTRPRFVNYQNTTDVQRILAFLENNGAIFHQPLEFSELDGDPRLEDIYNCINNARGIHVLRGFTSQLGLQGAETISGFLNKLANSSSGKSKLVILCYQCTAELDLFDSRIRGTVYEIEGNGEERGGICFLDENYPLAKDESAVRGLSNVGIQLEEGLPTVYVYTKRHASAYPHSIWRIEEKEDAFDALCALDSSTSTLERDMGTKEQWEYALQALDTARTWSELISTVYGTTHSLELAINKWKNADENKKWLYFIGLRLYGASSCLYLDKVGKRTQEASGLEREIYRTLLDEPSDSKGFASLYFQRKTILTSIGVTEDKELFDYVSLTGMYREKAIYYLTDITQLERQRILKLLADYEYDREALVTILKDVYPDLASYLAVCPFSEGDWLEEYFREYRYSKVTNHISDRLMQLAERQSVDRDFNRMPPRTSVLAEVKKSDTFLYWVDAMGLEFLGYIREKCKEYGMMLQISVCSCNLPSLTSFNKEFWESFDIDRKAKVTELDAIKHHGKEEYDYSKSRYPIHLCRELEIIDEVLCKARTKLLSQAYRKVLLMSDHGATRMAVIHENPINIDVNSRGTNGGRVCEYTESVAQIPYAVREDDWYILASYDHFKGAQWPHVEVHGGATLEEALVPLIQLSIQPVDIEIKVMTPIVEYSYKQNPVLEIFSKTILEDVRVLINDKWYEAEFSDDGQTFRFVMPNLKRRADHIAAVYANGIEIANGLQFSTKSKVGGMNTGRGGIL